VPDAASVGARRGSHSRETDERNSRPCAGRVRPLAAPRGMAIERLVRMGRPDIARGRLKPFDWIRAVTWLLVALLAARLLHLLVAWLRGALA